MEISHPFLVQDVDNTSLRTINGLGGDCSEGERLRGSFQGKGQRGIQPNTVTLKMLQGEGDRTQVPSVMDLRVSEAHCRERKGNGSSTLEE